MSLDELTALEAQVKQQNEDLTKAARMTTIVYVVLAAIVLIYTQVVVAKLKEATSPEAVAELATGMINEHAPLQRERLLATIQDNKDEWADSAMQQMHASLPALEAQVEVLLDQLANMLVEKIEDRLVPTFADYIKEDAASLAEQYKATTDDEIAAAYVDLFIQVIDQELDKFLNQRFINMSEELQKDLHKLSKPDAQLTKKEDAQRRLIQNWAHLTEHQEFGRAIFTDLLTAMKRKFDKMTAEEDFTPEQLDAVDELVDEEPDKAPVEGVEQPLRLIDAE